VKRSARSDADRVADILEAIAQIESWSPESAPAGMYRSAVLHQLIVIGEAANRLSTEFRDAHPDIPWRDVIGQRVQLAHQYWATQWARIQQTVSEDIPALKAALLKDSPPDLSRR
jgi:uncharacterized protein with HEPN domain